MTFIYQHALYPILAHSFMALRSRSVYGGPSNDVGVIGEHWNFVFTHIHTQKLTSHNNMQYLRVISSDLFCLCLVAFCGKIQRGVSSGSKVLQALHQPGYKSVVREIP